MEKQVFIPPPPPPPPSSPSFHCCARWMLSEIVKPKWRGHSRPRLTRPCTTTRMTNQQHLLLAHHYLCHRRHRHRRRHGQRARRTAHAHTRSLCRATYTVHLHYPQLYPSAPSMPTQPALPPRYTTCPLHAVRHLTSPNRNTCHHIHPTTLFTSIKTSHTPNRPIPPSLRWLDARRGY